MDGMLHLDLRGTFSPNQEASIINSYQIKVRKSNC